MLIKIYLPVVATLKSCKINAALFETPALFLSIQVLASKWVNIGVQGNSSPDVSCCMQLL